MKKILTTLVAAAAIGTTMLATASPADAWWRYGPGWGWGWGRGWGWGVGAVAAGAAVGAAAAAPYYYRGYYYPYGPYPYYGAGCRRVWNGYAWVRACY